MASASMALDRSVILASADASLRERLRNSLSGLRWDVREARGGAEAIAQLEGRPTEALLLDHWLPDLEVMELAEQIGALYPFMELLRIDGNPIAGGARSPRRHELLHAVREALGPSLRESSAPVPISSGEDAVAGSGCAPPRKAAPVNLRVHRSLYPRQRGASARSLARSAAYRLPSRSRSLSVIATSCWSWRARYGWLRRTPRRY